MKVDFELIRVLGNSSNRSSYTFNGCNGDFLAFSAWQGRAKVSKAAAERAKVPRFGLDRIKVIDDQVGFFLKNLKTGDFL